MKKFFSTLLALSLCTAAFAASRTTTISQRIDEIEVSNGIKVIYVPTATGKTTVTMQGTESKFNNIDVSSKGDKLVIRSKSKRKYSNNVSGVTVRVTAPAVSELEVNSGASVTCTRMLSRTGAFSVDVSSGATVNLGTVRCSKLECDSESGAKATINTIETNDADIECSSAAKVKVGKINATRLKAEANSAASIVLSAGKVDNADFRANSSASIRATGVTVTNLKRAANSCGTISVR